MVLTIVFLAIFVYVVSFVIASELYKRRSTSQKLENAVNASVIEERGLTQEHLVIPADDEEKMSEEKMKSMPVAKCKEKWYRIEQNRKLAEQQKLERLEKELREQEEQRLATIQKIKDSLQWKYKYDIEVCSLVYLPIDDECLYMDSKLVEGIICSGNILNATFRYRNNDLVVKDVVCPERGVLSICVEPFYKQSYELIPGMVILKVCYQENYVADYEQELVNKRLALEKNAQIEKENRATAFEEEKKQRALQKEKREKEIIRKKILAQKHRRELERKVHQEMYDKGELSMDGTKRRHIPHSVVSEVYHRDGARCVICGSTENLQLDHIIPFSKGGSDTAENLQILCQKCNLKKSNKI